MALHSEADWKQFFYAQASYTDRPDHPSTGQLTHRHSRRYNSEDILLWTTCGTPVNIPAGFADTSALQQTCCMGSCLWTHQQTHEENAVLGVLANVSFQRG